jgi:hypothetical protein
VWSKAGRFVEGLHAVGVILTKTSVNCVINLHDALLFTCYFYGFILCVIIVACMLMGIACICLLLFSVNPCIYIAYLSVPVLYILIFHKSYVRVYVLIACS